MAHLLCARLIARRTREPFACYNGTFFKYQGKPKQLFLRMCSQNSIAVLEMLGTLQKVSNYEIGGQVVVVAECNTGSIQASKCLETCTTGGQVKTIKILTSASQHY